MLKNLNKANELVPIAEQVSSRISKLNISQESEQKALIRKYREYLALCLEDARSQAPPRGQVTGSDHEHTLHPTSELPSAPEENSHPPTEKISWLKSERLLIFLYQELSRRRFIAKHPCWAKLLADHFEKYDGSGFD